MAALTRTIEIDLMQISASRRCRAAEAGERYFDVRIISEAPYVILTSFSTFTSLTSFTSLTFPTPPG